jgi:hypothetical protein
VDRSYPVGHRFRTLSSDLPHKQEQTALRVDLARGGVCVAGPGHSDRSTALATIAQAFVNTPQGIALDATTGWALVCVDSLESLSTTLLQQRGGTVTVALSRPEAVARVIDLLWLTMQSRLAGEHQAERVLAYDAADEILLLIDGFDILMRSLSSAPFTLWHERLVDLLVSGRQNRIYTAISTRNVRELELAVSSSMSATYELSAHYEGTETAAEDRLPGYGLTSDGLFFQFFVPAPENDARRLARRSLGASEQIVRFLDPEGWRGIGSPPPGDHSLATLLLAPTM